MVETMPDQEYGDMELRSSSPCVGDERGTEVVTLDLGDWKLLEKGGSFFLSAFAVRDEAADEFETPKGLRRLWLSGSLRPVHFRIYSAAKHAIPERLYLGPVVEEPSDAG